MHNRYLSIALTFLAGCVFSAEAVAQNSTANCRVSNSENAALTIIDNRLIYSKDGAISRIRLDRRAARVECTDIDGDAIDEVLAYSRSGAYTVHTLSVKKARAGLSSVCKKIRNLTRGEIWKSIASNHINDQRKLSTSFITLRSTVAPKNNCLYVYDKKGTLIHKLGRYFPSGTLYSSRYYGGHGCGDLKSASSVAATARSNTGSSAGYMTSGTGNCVVIPNIASCFNSSGC